MKMKQMHHQLTHWGQKSWGNYGLLAIIALAGCITAAVMYVVSKRK